MLTRDSQHQVPVLSVLYWEPVQKPERRPRSARGWATSVKSHRSQKLPRWGTTFESQLQSWFLLLAVDIARGEGLTRRGVKIKFGMLFPREELPDQKACYHRVLLGPLDTETCSLPWGLGCRDHLASLRMCSENLKAGPFWCLRNCMSSVVFVASSEVCGGGSEKKIRRWDYSANLWQPSLLWIEGQVTK